MTGFTAQTALSDFIAPLVNFQDHVHHQKSDLIALKPSHDNSLAMNRRLYYVINLNDMPGRSYLLPTRHVSNYTYNYSCNYVYDNIITSPNAYDSLRLLKERLLKERLLKTTPCIEGVVIILRSHGFLVLTPYITKGLPLLYTLDTERDNLPETITRMSAFLAYSVQSM